MTHQELAKALVGRIIKLEILKVQDLPSHNCLIIDDLILLSYQEAKQILDIEEEDEENKEPENGSSNTQDT